MPIEKAKKHYLGKDGHEKMNCAQAIIKAFQGKYNLNEDEINKYLAHGGGRAPGGLCGAIYATRELIKKHHLDKLEEFDIFIVALAGSDKCADIRKLKKMSCLGCIEKSAEFLSKCLKEEKFNE
ncbi:MAG: hypothetical protein WCV91_06835 [Candidatus Margulisiibacteriota bacterium]